MKLTIFIDKVNLNVMLSVNICINAPKSVRGKEKG